MGRVVEVVWDSHMLCAHAKSHQNKRRNPAEVVHLTRVGASHLGIIKGVGVKGYGVILIWDLSIGKFQRAITRHHWP